MSALATAEAVAIDPDKPWALRSYDGSRSDEDALHYLLGVSYCRSRAGQRAGASRAGGSRSLAERANGSTDDPDVVRRQKAFLDAHRPIWTWLLVNAEVTLAVDPEAPHIVWAWLITSAPNVVHAVGCKRSLIEAKLAVDVVTDLLGERMGKHQVCTLELPQMRLKGADAFGVDRPREWSLDPTWLITRLGEQRAA